ncbi:MAG: type IV-A pilus assembly ATPase PilB [Gammaproteobacteria bacterium]
MNTLTNTSQISGLASHLVYDGLLELEQAVIAVQEARLRDLPLISYLVTNKILSSLEIFSSCKKTFGLETIDLNNYAMNLLDNSLLSCDLIQRYRVIPIRKQNNILYLGTSDPTDRQALDAIRFYTGSVAFPILVAEDQLTNLIEKNFKTPTQTKNLELGLLKELSLEENINLIQENIVNYDEPLIRFVDHIIQHALQQSASDIHIEPFEKICRIRYRQDGVLYEIAEIPINLSGRLVTRLKVMAKLDISERRIPQDGRFQLNQIDIRMNTCPTLFGEKIVLRLLDINKVSLELNALGLTETQMKCFIDIISQPQGLILVTGPTGSGKTVTLYSALNYLNTKEKNISTVEDPVEIQLNGINQVHINPKINLNFATALRSFLRQDPDILMIGEIRDTETADIALQAAQTGHLVFSTLHTNSAIETLMRLQSMGIAPYNMASSITLIIAQRLVRKLCTHCKLPEMYPEKLLQVMGFENTKNTLYRAVGCHQCLQGYQGRFGIYEFLPMSSNITQLIMSNAHATIIMAQAQREGFLTLREVGFEKVIQGLTTLTELNRVAPK